MNNLANHEECFDDVFVDWDGHREFTWEDATRMAAEDIKMLAERESSSEPYPEELRRGILRSFMRNIPTELLVEELRRREGVDAIDVEPRNTNYTEVDGPAVILVVTD